MAKNKMLLRLNHRQPQSLHLLIGLLSALVLQAAIMGDQADAQAAPSAVPAARLAPNDVHQQFRPAKDDDDGDDYAESQELLYQWLNPRYSKDEQSQICGIAAYFAVLGAATLLPAAS